MFPLLFLAVAVAPDAPETPRVGVHDLRPVAIVKSAKTKASGFLIGPCTALTARHVLREQARGERVKVILPVAGISSRATVTNLGEEFPNVTKSYKSGDWAALRLDKCLGDEAGYFPVTGHVVHARQWAEEWGTAVLAGYPQSHDWRSGPYVDPRCTIISDSSQRIESNCYAYPGNSGSPLLQWQRVGQNWKLFAVGIVATAGWDATSPTMRYRVSEAVPIGRAVAEIAAGDPSDRMAAR